MNTCRRCGKEKPKDCFYANLRKEARCKQCVSEIRKASYAANPEKQRARANRYRKANPEKVRDTKLRQAYGVGIHYFEAKLAEQGGKCAGSKDCVKAVWRGKEVSMALDHNHDTLQPRGVLCANCNRAIGLVNESPETLRNLADYLEKYQKSG